MVYHIAKSFTLSLVTVLAWLTLASCGKTTNPQSEAKGAFLGSVAQDCDETELGKDVCKSPILEAYNKVLAEVDRLTKKDHKDAGGKLDQAGRPILSMTERGRRAETVNKKPLVQYFDNEIKKIREFEKASKAAGKDEKKQSKAVQKFIGAEIDDLITIIQAAATGKRTNKPDTEEFLANYVGWLFNGRPLKTIDVVEVKKAKTKLIKAFEKLNMTAVDGMAQFFIGELSEQRNCIASMKKQADGSAACSLVPGKKKGLALNVDFGESPPRNEGDDAFRQRDGGAFSVFGSLAGAAVGLAPPLAIGAGVIGVGSLVNNVINSSRCGRDGGGKSTGSWNTNPAYSPDFSPTVQRASESYSLYRNDCEHALPGESQGCEARERAEERDYQEDPRRQHTLGALKQEYCNVMHQQGGTNPALNDAFSQERQMKLGRLEKIIDEKKNAQHGACRGIVWFFCGMPKDQDDR